MSVEQLTFDDLAPTPTARVTVVSAPADSLPYHPLANVFPLLEGPEFEALVSDIRLHGVLEPIWLYHGQLLDGRNRYRACRALGIPCPSRIYDGNDPVEFVLSTNLRRRHLDESQRGMIAAKLATLPRGANQHVQICTPSQEAAAELLNVSRRTVIDARKVQADGAPEVIHAVDTGVMTVSAAQELIVLPRGDQAVTLEAARQAAQGSPLTAPRVRAAVQARITPPQRDVAPLTERDRACQGPRNQKPLGSVAWCWQTLDLLKNRWQRKDLTDQQFEETLDELRVQEVWNVIPPEAPYGSLDALLLAEIGSLAPVPPPAPPDVGLAYWQPWDLTKCLVGALCASEHVYPYAAGPDGQPGSLRWRRDKQECVVCLRLKQRRYRTRQSKATPKAKAKARAQRTPTTTRG